MAPETVDELELPEIAAGLPARPSYSLYGDFAKGVWRESPIFRQIIGLCPTLAVSNSAVNGFAMGAATLFVLFSASTLISMVKRWIPRPVRLAAYVVIIATFVTTADLVLAGNFPPISKALGPYVPLIVVNCLILSRAEAFASKQPVHRSMADAGGMGLGFMLAMLMLGVSREIFGSGSVFGFKVLGGWFEPWVIMLLPAGAFLTLGIMIGLINAVSGRKGGGHEHGH